MAGIVGLVTGGKSLVKYLLARFNDPYFDSFSYNDLVFSGGVIFLLSLILLIFTDLAHRLGGASLAAKPEKPGSSSKSAQEPVQPATQTGPASEPELNRESADEKLARLLKQTKG
jgi:hypothetical protein